jgi:DUF971 family protein
MQAEPPRLLRLNECAAALEIEWPDGTMNALAYTLLRARCLCSHCRSLRQSGQPVDPAEDTRVTEALPCGANAVQLVFSDGHARGIFPFMYLRELAEERAT